VGHRLKLITTFFMLVAIAGLLSWHSLQHMNRVYKPIKVGVSAGPQSEIMGLVKTLVAKDGLDVQIVEYTDYSKLNESLYQGNISINSFQHQPYLDLVLQDHNYDLTAIAKTVLLPIGIYSKKIDTIANLPPGSKVAIPKDLLNGSRALLLLEKAGLIVCRNTTTSSYIKTLDDIKDNPKNLSFIQVDATQIASIIDTVDLALINASYVASINLIPTRDALVLEDTDSPYVNLLVVRTKDIDNPDLLTIANAYRSEEVKNFVKEHFQGTMVTAW
jgi:D-methionine transport system substrate-binding protein